MKAALPAPPDGWRVDDRLKGEAAVYYKRAEEIRKTYLDAMKPQIDALESEKAALRKSIPTEVSLSILVNGTGLDTRDTTSASALAGAAITKSGVNRTLLARSCRRSQTG